MEEIPHLFRRRQQSPGVCGLAEGLAAAQERGLVVLLPREGELGHLFPGHGVEIWRDDPLLSVPSPPLTAPTNRAAM